MCAREVSVLNCPHTFTSARAHTHTHTHTHRSAEEEEEAHRRRAEGEGSGRRGSDDRYGRGTEDRTSAVAAGAVGGVGGAVEGAARGTPAPMCGGAGAVTNNRRLQVLLVPVSVCLPACLPACLSVCLSACMPTPAPPSPPPLHTVAAARTRQRALRHTGGRTERRRTERRVRHTLGIWHPFGV